MSGVVANLRLRRLAQHLHALGPRAVGEFLDELAGTDPDTAVSITANLERYGRLDPVTVRAIGGDDFPPLPIREVEQ